MENDMKELNMEEMEQVSGGWWPVIIAAAAAGYCFYKAVTEGQKNDWK